MGFAEEFAAFVHLDVAELREPLDVVGAITEGEPAPLREAAGWWSAGRVDSLALSLAQDIDGGERVLEGLRIGAKENTHGVLAALASFGEVLKAVVRRLKRLPEEFSGIIERFKMVAAALAKALGAASFSMTIDLPWSISVGFNWMPARPAAGGSGWFG